MKFLISPYFHGKEIAYDVHLQFRLYNPLNHEYLNAKFPCHDWNNYDWQICELFDQLQFNESTFWMNRFLLFEWINLLFEWIRFLNREIEWNRKLFDCIKCAIRLHQLCHSAASSESSISLIVTGRLSIIARKNISTGHTITVINALVKGKNLIRLMVISVYSFCNINKDALFD